MFNAKEIKKEFPILKRKVNGQNLHYLDNGASSQKPLGVIEAIKNCYIKEYSNVHRGLHFLSNLATENFEAVREKARKFLGASFEKEIIFTSGSTEGLNLISYSWANENLVEGDEIILTTLEHHANIVPWHFLRQRKNVTLSWVNPDENGNISLRQIKEKISNNTKMVCFTHMSNVFGSTLNAREICKFLRSKGIVSVVDGSQAAAHMCINVKDIDCDFYVITGHKIFGPTGTGVLYIKEDRLGEMIPFNGGGDMIKSVTKDNVLYNDAPHIFEAGTPNIAEIIGLGSALDFIESLDQTAVQEYEIKLSDYAREELKRLDWLIRYSFSDDNLAIFSFSVKGQGHPHDIATILDANGVAVRSGHHCAQPLMEFLGVSATCRASFSLYNNEEDVDALVSALKKCNRLFN